MRLHKVKIKHENDTISFVYVGCEEIGSIESLIQERVRDFFVIKEITEVCDEEHFFLEFPTEL